MRRDARSSAFAILLLTVHVGVVVGLDPRLMDYVRGNVVYLHRRRRWCRAVPASEAMSCGHI